MELYIDSIPVEVDLATGFAVSLSVAVVTDPRRARAGYTRTLRLPATAANDAVFGHAADPASRDRFNASAHVGTLEHEGCVLIEGPLTLAAAVVDRYYEVHIIGASRQWASAASSRSLSTLPVDWSRTLSGTAISSSWSGDTPVRFLPVVRRTQALDYSSGSVIAATKVFSSDDYHPFLHVATLLRAIFADAGYTLVSDFVSSPMFSSLYISGNYPTRDVSEDKADMDFLARRIAPASATADSRGRVWADPYRTSFTVGNIVDTADPTLGPWGDVFSQGGCFQMDDNRVVFIPPREVSAGFRYHLAYTTDYRIATRTSLVGFDTVYLGEQSARTFTLANPWPDRRGSFRSQKSYKLAVFDHAAPRQYRLRYTCGGATVDGAILSGRFSTVEISDTGVVADPVLWSREDASSPWRIYNDDWALYDGMVGETGTLDVRITLRTAPRTFTPTSPAFFDNIYFGGAEPGMTLTVGDGCWVRPVFYAQPTEGSSLVFADVCAHNVSRMDLVDALRQMFDLCFHTDIRGRTVRLEPADTFFSSGAVIDWSDRIDTSRPVTVAELGADLSRRMEWCYRGGDSAADRFNRNNGGRLGLWSTTVESYAAADATSTWVNPMFAPSLSVSGVCPGAPSALLIQAGDTSSDTSSDDVSGTGDLNFTPKIVRYEGPRPLPEGENWGWPLSGGSYPRLSFHDPEGGFTLCFEDRDGCTGLHRMWDRDVRVWNRGRRVTLWLSLDAADISSLSFPSGVGPDFRSLYRLTVYGESALYRLEQVCDYTPGAPSTQCVFIKHIP